MFSLAYVLLPFSDQPVADAITNAVARFRHGRRGDVPEAWLAFEDETAVVQEMHRTRYHFRTGEGLRIDGGESWYLNSRAVSAEMQRHGTADWTVRFFDVEPDIDRFAERFLVTFDRHPVTGGFGFWRNALGRWDWWELGGRFDGVITGEQRRAGRARSLISSGPSAGRDLLTHIEDALADAAGGEPLTDISIDSDVNVELVSRLIDDLEADERCRLPGALVLPPRAAADDHRWLASWPEIGPSGALDLLGVSAAAPWREIVDAAYRRFPDHWAAAIAFHH